MCSFLVLEVGHLNFGNCTPLMFWKYGEMVNNK
jgi:hypothetical protein